MQQLTEQNPPDTKSSQSSGSHVLFLKPCHGVLKAWPDPKKRVIEVVTDMATVAMTQAEDGVLGQGAEAMSLERRRAAMFPGEVLGGCREDRLPLGMVPRYPRMLFSYWYGHPNVRVIQISAKFGNKETPFKFTRSNI